MMRIRDKQGVQEEQINLLPLIDTLFFLLLFFLVGTQFKEEERDIGVQLPSLASSQPLSALPQQVIINIREDGQTLVAGAIYGPDELGGLLRGIADSGSGREVLIRADERSMHRYFAGVAALARRAGISEVKIGYVLEEPRAMELK
jgi:biopolymer transport protein ExbD